MAASLNTTSPERNWPKTIGLVLLGLLAFVLIAAIGGYLWLTGSGGRAFVERTVEDLEIAGQSVALDGLSGSVLGEFEVDSVTLSGPNGVWLIARDITVDWRPSAILSKTLDVDAVRIGDLDVLQRPVFVQGEPSEDPRITTFDVDGIELPDIELAEAVIGRAVELAASGDLQHGPQGGEAVIAAQSDQGDRVDADLAWSPELVLSGEADVDGAPGGLIANLLRLNTDQSVEADITTQGDVTNIVAQVDGQAVANLAITRSQSRVGVDGTIQPDRLPILAPIAPVLGGETRIDAVVPLDQGATAALTLRAPNVTLDAEGVRQDGTIVLDRLALTATDPLQSFDLDGVALGTLVLDGQATLGDAYTFDGTVDARAIAYQDYAVDRLSGPTTLRFENGTLDFDTALTGTAHGGPMARANGAKLIATGQLDLDARRVTLGRADISLPGLGFNGRGTVGYGDTPSANLSGRYTVDTGVFRDGPAAKLSGQADIRSTADGPRIDLTGRATDITGLADAVQPLAVGGLDYTARVEIEEGEVLVPRFTAGNDRLTATGSARWADGRIESDIDYRVEQYDFAAVSASGITGSATVSGPPSQIAFDTNLTAETLDAGALSTTDANIMASGTYADGITRADGTLSAESEQGRVETSGSVTLDGGSWDVQNLRGDLGGLNATGTLSGIGGDIAAIRGDLVVSGTSPLVPAETIEGRILLSDAQVDVDATLTGVDAWRLQDATVDILAKGPREAVVYSIQAEGQSDVRDLTRPFTLAANGMADLRTPGVATQATFDMSLGKLSLAGDVAARRDAEGWAADLSAQGFGGSMDVALSPGADGAFTFDVKNVKVSELAILLARPVTAGTLSGAGEFTFDPDKIEGVANIAFNDLASPVSDAEPVSMITDIRLRNESLIATLKATDGGLIGAILVEGPVDTYPRAPFMTYPPTQHLQGRTNLRGEIGPLVELFLPPQTDVSGQIETDVTFTLPPDADALDGRFVLSDGRFEQGAIGLRLRDIAMTAELSGDTIIVPTLSAEGVDGGTLRGSGRMGLDEATGTVRLRAEKLRVIKRSEGNAEVSGDLSISRTAELFRLAGELQVTDAYINIASLPEPGLPTLEVDFGDVEEDEDTVSLASQVTELDLKVVSDGRIRVRGRGLNASMSLDAAVTGSFDDPTVSGEMSIARGRFDFLGKRFEFRDSSVLIRDRIIESILNFEAVRSTADLTAVVAVTGTLDRPEISLTSEPTLPEDEVLSRILFGRSPTQLSAIETARLAAALTQLTGGSGFDLFGSLENAVGLDTLEVGQNETGAAQLTTGKYLSDDVYLEVRTAAEGTPGLAVEWQIRDNISLEAETVPNERQSLSVQWKRDFD